MPPAVYGSAPMAAASSGAIPNSVDFSRRPRSAARPFPIPTARVRALYVDRNGRIWVATRNAGVYLLDTARKQSRQFRHQEANPESLSDDSIFALAEDASGQIWIGTQSGLDRLDPDSGRIDHFGARLREAGVPNEAALKVNALYADARGTLWIGMDSGLAKFDAPAGAFTVLRHRAVDPNSLPDGRVTSLLEDDEQRLWVGTSDGLALLDRRTDTCVVLRHDPANPSSLPDNNVVSLYQDRSGQLWIGTKTGGLAHWNPRSWSFGHRRLTEGANNVTSFADDGRGTLWIGSFGAGVAALDSHTGALTRYHRGAASPLALRDDNVMALATDERRRVWIGTMSAGVEVIDPVHGEILHIANLPSDPASLPAAGIMSMFRDARGRIWVGTYGGGARIDPDSNRVTRYPFGGEDSHSLSSDRATAIAEDHTGLIWVGTDGGVSTCSTGFRESRRFLHDSHDPASAECEHRVRAARRPQGRRLGGHTRRRPRSSGGRSFRQSPPAFRKPGRERRAAQQHRLRRRVRCLRQPMGQHQPRVGGGESEIPRRAQLQAQPRIAGR